MNYILFQESPLVLVLSISLAALTLFILTALVVCLVRNRNTKKPQPSSPAAASSGEAAKVRSTLINPSSTKNTYHQQHNYIQKPPSTLSNGMNNPPPSLDSLYAGGCGGPGSINNAPLPPPPTPVQWLYGRSDNMDNGGNATVVSSGANTSGGSSSIYTDSSQFGGIVGGGCNNTYEVPRYATGGGNINNNGGSYGLHQHRTSPVGQPAYIYGGYRH